MQIIWLKEINMKKQNSNYYFGWVEKVQIEEIELIEAYGALPEPPAEPAPPEPPVY